MRTVTVEEHCLTPELRAVLGAQIHPYYPVHRWPPALEARLADIGAGRIAEMDASGIDVQVLSTAQPGWEHIDAARAVPVARAFNDRIAEAIHHLLGRRNRRHIESDDQPVTCLLHRSSSYPWSRVVFSRFDELSQHRAQSLRLALLAQIVLLIERRRGLVDGDLFRQH